MRKPTVERIRLGLSQSFGFDSPSKAEISMAQASPPLRRTIKKPELHQMVPLADSTIWEMERRGEDIIHLEVGEPDFDTPSNIVESAVDALHKGWTHYGPSAGLPELREAIASKTLRDSGFSCRSGWSSCYWHHDWRRFYGFIKKVFCIFIRNKIVMKSTAR